ncbi:unnamed protein product [Closterium sp. NIES-53]
MVSQTTGSSSLPSSSAVHFPLSVAPPLLPPAPAPHPPPHPSPPLSRGHHPLLSRFPCFPLSISQTFLFPPPPALTSPDAAMLAKVGGITDPKPADCLIDVATPNPQWARYLDEWDAVLLETTTHWRSLSKGPRMVYTNENWSKLSLDQYQAHRWVIAGDICLCLCLSTSASASASTSASASASASASGDMLSLSVSPHPFPHSPLSQSLTSIC